MSASLALLDSQIGMRHRAVLSPEKFIGARELERIYQDVEFLANCFGNLMFLA
jgi:hypothetical protein